MFRKLWTDDAGVVAIEYLFLCVIVGLGMAVGYSAVSDSLNAEYVELGQAILTLDDGYWSNAQASFGFFGVVGGKMGTLVVDSPGFVGYAHNSFAPITTSVTFAFASP